MQRARTTGIQSQQAEDRIDELVAVANSAVTGTVHPYYELLLLTTAYKEAALTAFAKVPNSRIARANGLIIQSERSDISRINLQEKSSQTYDPRFYDPRFVKEIWDINGYEYIIYSYGDRDFL